MNFRSERVRDFYLLTTEVENIFINEYMPQAPGEYVKVYLYALLYSKQETSMTCYALAKQLGITEEEIDKAWAYWESMGVVRREVTRGSGREYDIIFVNLRELMYANTTESVQKTERLPEDIYETETKELFDYIENLKGKPLSPKEMQEIAGWRCDFCASLDVIKTAIKYCYAKNKTQLRYIEAVLSEWTEKGIKTADEAEQHLELTAKRFAEYKRILNSLGIVGRMATDGEKEIIDRWFDDMGFSIERIIDACHKTVGIQNPNVNYVNKILENWHKDAATYGRDVNKKTAVNQAVLQEYYEYLGREAQRRSQLAKEEVYAKLPRIAQIDETQKDLGSRLSRAVLGGTSEDVEEIKRLSMLLEQERAVLLTENNYPLDYTDIKYLCAECKDTGINEAGRRCGCAKERIGEAEIWLNAKENSKAKK